MLFGYFPSFLKHMQVTGIYILEPKIVLLLFLFKVKKIKLSNKS